MTITCVRAVMSVYERAVMSVYVRAVMSVLWAVMSVLCGSHFGFVQSCRFSAVVMSVYAGVHVSFVQSCRLCAGGHVGPSIRLYNTNCTKRINTNLFRIE